MTKSVFAKEQLRSYIERIERLAEERDALSEDMSEVYAEAKGDGFDTKIMRQVVRLRKLDKADFQEQEAMLELYKRALGMIDNPMDDPDPPPLVRLSIAKSEREKGGGDVVI